MSTPAPVVELAVDEASAGERLDRFLAARTPGFSRGRIRAALAEGRVRVNGARVRTGVRLAAGDVVRLELRTPVEGRLPLAAPELALAVVLERPGLLVVDKPAGMPTLPLAPDERTSLASALVARYPELHDVGAPLEAGVLHRLDTETSGLVMVARSREAYAAFRAALDAGEVEKSYLALVAGSSPERLVMTAPLAHDPVAPQRMLAVSDEAAVARLQARPARTEARALRRLATYTLVEARITRGARHQIRVHLAAAGHPIAGDRLYGDPRAPRPAERHFLHACRLRLTHPVSGERVEVESPLPAELGAWLSSLEPR